MNIAYLSFGTAGRGDSSRSTSLHEFCQSISRSDRGQIGENLVQFRVVLLLLFLVRLVLLASLTVDALRGEFRKELSEFSIRLQQLLVGATFRDSPL